MSVTLPSIDELEKQIGEKSRELKLLRSLQRILRNKVADDRLAEANRRFWEASHGDHKA